MINIIIPMAGAGSRFKNQGFDTPKPLIQINNHSFFYWASLPITRFLPTFNIIFIVLKEHIIQYNIDEKIKHYYPNAKIVVLDEILNGASFSAMKGIDLIDNDYPISIIDCDVMCLSSSFINDILSESFNVDGGVLTFFSSKNIYSYALVDSDNMVVKTAEKQQISNNAISGYIFKNKDTYKKYFQEYISKPLNTEYYISGIFNVMLLDNLNIKNYPLDFIVSYGTPEEFKTAQDNLLFNIMDK